MYVFFVVFNVCFAWIVTTIQIWSMIFNQLEARKINSKSKSVQPNECGIFQVSDDNLMTQKKRKEEKERERKSSEIYCAYEDMECINKNGHLSPHQVRY